MRDVKVTKRPPAGREQARAANGRKRRRRRKRSYMLYYILLLLFVLIAFATLSVTVFFNISTIQIEGLSTLKQTDVQKSVSAKVGDNLFRLSLPKIEARILEQNVYIDKVVAKRKLPSTLLITVTEAKPALAVPQGKNYCILSAAGRILEVGVASPPKGAMIVSGIEIKDPRRGDFVPLDSTESVPANESADSGSGTSSDAGAQNAQRLSVLRELQQAFATYKITDVTEVDVSNIVSIGFVWQNRVKVELGSVADLSYKMTFVKKVLDEKVGPDEHGTLDAHDADKLYFLPQSSSKPSSSSSKASSQTPSGAGASSNPSSSPSSQTTSGGTTTSRVEISSKPAA